MTCPSTRCGVDATGRSPRGDGGSRGQSLRRGSGPGASPRHSWSPALPTPRLPARCRTGRDRAAGETHVYRSTRAVFYFILRFGGLFFGGGFFFFLNISSMMKKIHPAFTLICNQKLRDMVGLPDGILPPWAAGAAGGVLPPPLTCSRVRHGAGDPGPQMPPGTAASLLLLASGVWPNLGNGRGQEPSLPCLLTFHFCLKT